MTRSRTLPAVLAAATVLLAACSSSQKGAPPVSAGGSQPPPANSSPPASTPAVVTTTASSAAVTLADAVIHYAAADGTKVTFHFALQPVALANAPALRTRFPNGAPCTADPQRDAVFAGTLTISNDTPAFPAPVDMVISSPTPAYDTATLRLGIAYSNGPECTDLNGEYAYGAMKPPLATTLTASPWGPVAIEFVISNVYSPTHPSGDQTTVSGNDPSITATEGPPFNGQLYKLTAAEGHVITGTYGAVQLDLASLMP